MGSERLLLGAKEILAGFWAATFSIHGENRKKSAYVKRETKDIAGASSQPKMGTLSACINIGVSPLNMTFPSNAGFFSENSYFLLTIDWQPLFVLFRIN